MMAHVRALTADALAVVLVRSAEKRSDAGGEVGGARGARDEGVSIQRAAPFPLRPFDEFMCRAYRIPYVYARLICYRTYSKLPPRKSERTRLRNEEYPSRTVYL